jgi:DNA-binding transcriptional regulator YiaG
MKESTERIDCGQLIKEREALGLTQLEMAHALLAPVGTYRKWERKSHAGGRRVPGIIVPALNWIKSRVKK